MNSLHSDFQESIVTYIRTSIHKEKSVNIGGERNETDWGKRMKEAREREMLQHYQLYYLNVFIVKHTMYYNTIKIYKERAINSQASKLKKKKFKWLIFFFKFTHLSFFSSLKYDDELSSFICEVVFSKHVLFSFLQSSQY